MIKRWLVVTAFAMWLGVGGMAEAATAISSELGGEVTISILDAAGNEITDGYLATLSPNGPVQEVYVVVNGSTPATPVLEMSVPTATLPLASGTAINPFRSVPTTSRFPGTCTNTGPKAASLTDEPLDFELGGPTPIGGRTAYPLRSLDCGGMAVIKVGSDTFVLPRDANGNGIPDALETFNVPLVPGLDNDNDGISNFDELRGFIVSGSHVRGNPTVKDLLVHLVRPQCGSASLLAGGTVVYPITGTGRLDSNLQELIPVVGGGQVRFLGSSLPSSGSPASTVRTSEWVDHFSAFFLNGSTETWTYCTVADCNEGSTFNVTTATGTPPAEDRVINKNRIYGAAQKGLRLTECVDATLTSPYGTARWGSAASGRDEAVVYTKRIENYVKAQGTSSAQMHYSTFDPVLNVWTELSPVSREFIISKIIQYIVAMEIAHNAKLNQELTSTIFPHYTAGTGNNLDSSFRVATKGSPQGVKWYIPQGFSAADQGLVTITP